MFPGKSNAIVVFKLFTSDITNRYQYPIKAKNAHIQKRVICNIQIKTSNGLKLIGYQMRCYVTLCNNYAICNKLQIALNCNAVCNTLQTAFRVFKNADKTQMK